MKQKTKQLIMTLVALLAVTTGAWADETPLTTITPTGDGTYSETTAGAVRVTPAGSFFYSGSSYGWRWDGYGSLTVTANEGYTITRCVFIQQGKNQSVTISEAPFALNFEEWLCIKNPSMDGVTSIEVYGTASSGTTVPLTWDATAKTATLTNGMPAGNVTVSVEYYPGMLTFGSGAIEGGKLEVVGLGLGTTSFTVPNEWNHNSTRLASSHFEGFKSVTEEEAKAWPGVPATGLVALYYNYDETAQKWDLIYFKDGAFDAIYKGVYQQLATIYNLPTFGYSVFYTTGMQTPAGFEKDEEGNIYVKPGTEFKVKAVPAEGFHLVSLTDGTNDIEVDADGIATLTMPDEYADLTLTATFSDKYTVTLNAEGLSEAEAAAWKAATGTNDPAAFPLENVKYGTEVKVTYTGTKKVIGVKAEKKSAAPATVLSGALVDGATIKVNFKWRMENSGDYVQGVYNAASGTFTASKGGYDWNDDERAVYKVEKSGNNIIIGASFNNFSDSEAMVWTFNTTNDTYTTTNGTTVNAHPDWYGLISVTLNGTDITSQLTAQ